MFHKVLGFPLLRGPTSYGCLISSVCRHLVSLLLEQVLVGIRKLGRPLPCTHPPFLFLSLNNLGESKGISGTSFTHPKGRKGKRRGGEGRQGPRMRHAKLREMGSKEVASKNLGCQMSDCQVERSRGEAQNHRETSVTLKSSGSNIPDSFYWILVK